MTLQDLMDRAMLITGLHIGNEALFYYNEVIDLLLAKYPQKISSVKTECFYISENRLFEIPSNWASVVKVKNEYGQKVRCEGTDDSLIFPYSGVFSIFYTVKPGYMKALNEKLEHNRIFDMCIPYYFAWKMCERDQLSANRIQKYQQLFEDYLTAAARKRARQGLKYIKALPL